MRREECDRIVTGVQELTKEAEISARQLGLIKLILNASPETLARVESSVGAGAAETAPTPPTDLAAISIDVEELSHQLKGVLKRKGYQTLQDINKPEAALREDGFQDRSIIQIRAALEARGHKLE